MRLWDLVHGKNCTNDLLTQTLTHTGHKSVGDLIFLEQKRPESVENQGLEGIQSVSKEGGLRFQSGQQLKKALKTKVFKAFLLQF